MSSRPSPFTGIELDADDEIWRADGVCAEVDPDLWFPDVVDTSRVAKRICAGCPVTDECLQWAITHDERFGVWGGLSVSERDRLVRGRSVS